MTFEKSIRLGFVNQLLQESILYTQVNTTSYSILKATQLVIDQLGEKIIKNVDNDKLSRYKFELPVPLITFFKEHEGFFDEEIMVIRNYSKEFMLEANELLLKPVTKNCTLSDVILFQRFFIFINQIMSTLLQKKMNKKNKERVINSLIPSFNKDRLIGILENFIDDKNKINELIDIFTYEKSYKLDLLYTPFLGASNCIVFSSMLVSKSNLLRNIIAYSYLSKNQIVNNSNGLDPLVNKCYKLFIDAGYTTLKNKKYSQNGSKGEIDVLVIHDNDIILIECKSPLSPVNNFELRSSIDHIEKANKQLDLSKSAFLDDSFYKSFCKQNNIHYKNREIKTCIVFGNRLLNGYKNSSRPIRYIHELGMVLDDGIIRSSVGSWSVWESDTFQHQDLLNYLSDEKTFIHYMQDSMEQRYVEMYVKGKKARLETYVLNQIKVFELFDKNLKIINKDEKIRNDIRLEFKEQGMSTDL